MIDWTTSHHLNEQKVPSPYVSHVDQPQPDDHEKEKCAHVAVQDKKKAYTGNESHKINL